MADTFKIEIPVEVTNRSDTGSLKKLEQELNRIYQSASKVGSAGQSALAGLGSGAAAASSSMQGVASSTQEAAAATEKIDGSADKAADSFESVGQTAQEAGQQASSAFNSASGAVDKFSARVEKSNAQIQKTFAQKIQMTLQAIDKVSPILKSVGTSIKNLTSKAWHVAVKMKDLVTAPFRKLKQMIMSPVMMTLGITGIGMGAGSFISTFQDFTAGMSNVKALSGATNEEFIKLTETAEQLGATTKFTATEASQGMQYLAMAGWDTNQIIAAMPGLLDLAAAGGTELGTAADIVSDVMTAMGMSADQASRAADVFARTATSTNTTIENLGESLKYAAPVAHSFGLELSEVSTLTGMMANAGIKGSMAGTALRSSLMQMASPTKAAQTAMNKLGLTFSDSSGKMKDMRTIISELGTAFGGLSQQEKLAMADDIFGTRASSAWLAVIEQGTDEYEKLYEAIDNSAGAAREMANTQLDNLAGDVTLLNSALDGMKISVMKELSPALREGVQWLTAQIPKLTEKITEIATKAIGKLKEVKDFLKDVFNSSDFQNAEGFAEKFFVAWDKIIAEPFQKWWDGGGQQTILDAVAKLGKNLGELYHGVISGIFAALKGEEIDFEGLNLTGIAKAGAEAAKNFIQAFKEAFDIGGLFGEMPGLLKAGLLGFGAIKLGSGALGITKTIASIKMAFGGVTAAAAPATSAIAGVGAQAAAGVAGAGKFAASLGGIKAVLAAIPGWGWVAAAAIAAVTAGIILYNKAQADHEQALLDTGKAAQKYEQDYVQTANNVAKAMETMDEIKKIQILIEENKGGNAQVIAEVNTELEGIIDRTVYVTAVLGTNKPGFLDETKLAEYQKQLETVKGQIAYVQAKLKDGDTLTEQEILDYQKQLEELKGVKADLEAAIKNKQLTIRDVEAYQAELEGLLTGVEAELKVKLTNEGYDPVTAGLIIAEFNAVQSGTKELTMILADKTELKPDQIQEYVTKLTEFSQQKAEAEIFIKGSGIPKEEIATYQTELEKVKGHTAELALKLAEGEGTMSPDEWNALAEEYQAGLVQQSTIELLLKGATANPTEVAAVEKQIAELKGKAEGLLLKLAYSKGSDLSQDDLSTIAALLKDIGDHTFVAEVGLKNTGMGKKEIQELIDQQNKLYKTMVETTGGVFTQRDVEQGRITQEDYDWWVQDQSAKAANELSKFNLQVQEDRGNVDELVQKREAAQAAKAAAEQQYGGMTEDQKFLSGLENSRQGLVNDYLLGKIDYDAMVSGANNLAQQAREHQFTEETGSRFDLADANTLLWGMDGELNNGAESIFTNALKELGYFKEGGDQDISGYDAEIAKYDEALNRQYQNEVRAQELNNFAGLGFESGLTTATIGDLAAQYGNLDEAGQQAFENALKGIAELNAQTDYVSEDQKTNVQQLVETAQQSVQVDTNTAILGDVTANIANLKGQMEELGDAAPDEQFTAQIQQVGEALAALGIEDIDLTTVEGLQSAMDAIAEVDLTKLDFDTAVKSLEAFGTSTDAAKAKLEAAQQKAAAAKAQMDSLAGTYEVIINYTENGKPQTPGENAYGGIYDGAFLSWVAEDGPEAIIPLGADKRGRGLDLWYQAGRLLGINEYANGGLVDDDGEDIPVAVPTGGSGSGGGNTFQISVESHPVFEIQNDGDGGDILAKIREHQSELAEIFGGAIADQMADIVANMV